MGMMRKMRNWLSFSGRDRVINKQARDDGDILYGSHALKKRVGFGMVSRPPKDYDFYSDSPQRSANKLQRNLDMESGGDNYHYRKKNIEGNDVFMVYHNGDDMIPYTDDDVKIADYMKKKRGVIFDNIDGMNMVRPSKMLKDKMRTVRNPRYSYRHDKDKKDIMSLKISKRLGWLR